MSEISRDEVAHLAKLSRLALSDDELKAIAAVVAAPCHEGGVGRAIERYALGGERL